MNLPVTNRISVLLLISSEGYFGVENMLVNLGVALGKIDCRCIVGIFRDARFQTPEIADRARAQGLEVELIPCAGRLDPRSVFSIRQLLNQHQVNVLHSHGYKADLYACAAAAWSRTGLIATCHNWLGESVTMRAYAALDRLVLRAFDRVVVVSSTVAQSLRSWGVDPAAVHLVANGVDVERFRSGAPTLKNEPFFDGEPLVGFVGRLVPEKGGEVLLRAAQLVVRSNRKAKFVLVGEGPARQEWESLASKLGIRERVLFTGLRDDMPSVYASLSMLVLPSLCEAMPMCVLEAMAAAKPVIATNVGAVPRVIDPDCTGVLLEPGDVKGLAAAMTRLLDAPGIAEWMGRNGEARAIEQFSADSMAEQYLELYRKVANLHPVPGGDLSFLPTA